MTTARRKWRLFEATGVELEYMIVDRETLDVRPVADELMKAATGSYNSDAEFGPIAWSNELALHVVELKTNGPAERLEGLGALFQEHVRRVNALLAPMGCALMPSAMHPWMDPLAEMRLWPHEHSPVYEAYDRIFSCKGHGWANLQSAHINLPFADDEEFGKLHAAIRLVLPILPALSASSPVADGRITGTLDTRLDVYRSNSRRVPSVAGQVIPEPVFTRADYEREILGRIYADLAALDPEGVLRDEFANSRGCIARFGRGSIEIRVIDVQECPAADVAICALVVAVVRALAEGELSDPREQRTSEVGPLARIFLDAVRSADESVVTDARYLELLGMGGAAPIAAGELWRRLAERTLFNGGAGGEWRAALNVIFGEGVLARRILRRIGGEGDRSALASVYRELCGCLADGRMLHGAR